MKITILGAAGGIGQNLALLLTTHLNADCELLLYDISPVIIGVGIDLSHIPSSIQIYSFYGKEIDLALSSTDIVLIVAGVARKPGMNRDDLFSVNASIIQELITQIANYAPQALIGIVTNPINSMVVIAANILIHKGVYNSRKLFGITTLDIIRINNFVAKMKHLPINKIDIPVIGGHSTQTILPLLSQISCVSFTNDEVIELTQNVRNAGTEVVEAKAGKGSATLAMAYAAMRFTLSLIKALQGDTETIECAYVQSNNLLSKFFAQPLLLGPDGIRQYKSYGALSSFEEQSLKEIYDILNKDIERGENFI